MKKCVLIFGTFNPITNAHISLGLLAKALYKDSDIYFVIAKTSFLQDWKHYDNKDILSEDARLKLCKEAVAEYDYMHILDVELTDVVDGKTYNTVKYIKDSLHYEEVYIICGTDKLTELHQWYRVDDLVTEVKFLVVQRDYFNIQHLPPFVQQYRDKFEIFTPPTTLQEVSSTKIRNAFNEHNLEYIKEYVPKNVYLYYKSLV